MRMGGGVRGVRGEVGEPGILACSGHTHIRTTVGAILRHAASVCKHLFIDIEQAPEVACRLSRTQTCGTNASAGPQLCMGVCLILVIG